jgi:hypothetical protein
MKLKFAGRSGLRVHLSEAQLKQEGDLEARADSNSVIPGVGRWVVRIEEGRFGLIGRVVQGVEEEMDHHSP